MVVYDIGQVIGWHAITFEQHLVIQCVSVYFYIASDTVFKLKCFTFGTFKSDDKISVLQSFFSISSGGREPVFSFCGCANCK